MESLKIKMFEKGVQLYKERKYSEARRIFESLLEYEEYFYKALRMIVKINIRQYRYREARELILNYMYLENFNTLELLSSIEDKEYNYNRSIFLISSAISRVSNIGRMNSLLVDMLINNGEFDKARDVILSAEQVLVPDKLRLIMIDIIVGDIDSALKELNEMDVNSLNFTMKILYVKAHYLIMAALGKDPRLFPDCEIPYICKYKRLLFESYDGVKAICSLVTNNKKPLENHLYYSPDLDVFELVKTVKERIKGINPRFSNMTQIYGVRLDNPIGKINDEDVYDVLAITPIGSEKIISITVTDFSSEFDSEELSTDSDLRKRLMMK